MQCYNDYKNEGEQTYNTVIKLLSAFMYVLLKFLQYTNHNEDHDNVVVVITLYALELNYTSVTNFNTYLFIYFSHEVLTPRVADGLPLVGFLTFGPNGKPKD